MFQEVSRRRCWRFIWATGHGDGPDGPGAGNDALGASQIMIQKFTREQPDRGSQARRPGVQVGPQVDKGPGQPFTQSRQRFILATGHGDGAGYYALSARPGRFKFTR